MDWRRKKMMMQAVSGGNGALSSKSLQSMIKMQSEKHKAAHKASTSFLSRVAVNKCARRRLDCATERAVYLKNEENQLELGEIILRVRKICRSTFHAINFTKRDKSMVQEWIESTEYIIYDYEPTAELGKDPIRQLVQKLEWITKTYSCMVELRIDIQHLFHRWEKEGFFDLESDDSDQEDNDDEAEIVEEQSHEEFQLQVMRSRQYRRLKRLFAHRKLVNVIQAYTQYRFNKKAGLIEEYSSSFVGFCTWYYQADETERKNHRRERIEQIEKEMNALQSLSSSIYDEITPIVLAKLNQAGRHHVAALRLAAIIISRRWIAKLKRRRSLARKRRRAELAEIARLKEEKRMTASVLAKRRFRLEQVKMMVKVATIANETIELKEERRVKHKKRLFNVKAILRVAAMAKKASEVKNETRKRRLTHVKTILRVAAMAKRNMVQAELPEVRSGVPVLVKQKRFKKAARALSKLTNFLNQFKGQKKVELIGSLQADILPELSPRKQKTIKQLFSMYKEEEESRPEITLTEWLNTTLPGNLVLDYAVQKSLDEHQSRELSCPKPRLLKPFDPEIEDMSYLKAAGSSKTRRHLKKKTLARTAGPHYQHMTVRQIREIPFDKIKPPSPKKKAVEFPRLKDINFQELQLLAEMEDVPLRPSPPKYSLRAPEGPIQSPRRSRIVTQLLPSDQEAEDSAESEEIDPEQERIEALVSQCFGLLYSCHLETRES